MCFTISQAGGESDSFRRRIPKAVNVLEPSAEKGKIEMTFKRNLEEAVGTGMSRRGKGAGGPHFIFFVLGFLLVGLLAALPATAQTNEENFGQLEFNFVTPGARATAMGGAFIALADDATAAVTNPAGLVVLGRPEFSFEYKWIDYTREMYLAEDSWYPEKNPTDIGSSVSSPSFFSFVYPKKRFTLALYRNETMNFSQEFHSQGPIVGDFGDGLQRAWRSDSALDLTLINYGLSGAFRFTDSFSAGVSVRYSTFDLNTTLTRTNAESGAVETFSRVDDSDATVNFNAGLLYTPGRAFSVALVYHSNGSYKVDWSKIEDPNSSPSVTEEPVEFNIPDVYGIGFAYRPRESMVLTMDIIRVEYADMEIHQPLACFENTVPADYKVDNAVEFHFGGEQVWLLGETPVSLRLGMYGDPDSSYEYKGRGQGYQDEAARLMFPGGDHQMHYTIGGGFVLWGHLQFDAAFDYAKFNNQVSISTIYRF